MYSKKTYATARRMVREISAAMGTYCRENGLVTPSSKLSALNDTNKNAWLLAAQWHLQHRGDKKLSCSGCGSYSETTPGAACDTCRRHPALSDNYSEGKNVLPKQ